MAEVERAHAPWWRAKRSGYVAQLLRAGNALARQLEMLQMMQTINHVCVFVAGEFSKRMQRCKTMRYTVLECKM